MKDTITYDVYEGTYGDLVEEGLTFDEARASAKRCAEDAAADEIFDTPFVVVMNVPVERFLVKRPEPNPVVCECVTVRTCIVG